MENERKLEIFRTAPVPKAVMQNALPAMAAVLMILVYNLADTFFIGQTHDALMVAAVSLATPVFGAVYFAGVHGAKWTCMGTARGRCFVHYDRSCIIFQNNQTHAGSLM